MGYTEQKVLRDPLCFPSIPLSTYQYDCVNILSNHHSYNTVALFISRYTVKNSEI